MLRALSPNAFSAPWFNSSRKSGSFIVLGSKPKRCHFCLAVVVIRVWRIFVWRSPIGPRGSVCRLYWCSGMFVGLLCGDVNFHLFWQLRLHLDHFMKGIFKELNLLAFPVDGHCIRIDWTNSELWVSSGRFCKLVSESASLWIGSCAAIGGSCSGVGYVASRESLWSQLDWLDCSWRVASRGKLRESWNGDSLSPVTM